MKWKPLTVLAGISSLCLSLGFAAGAQNCSVDWPKISGGGGTSAGGNFFITGTIGQPDAGAAMSGGNFSVTGGFWSLIQVVPTPGLPRLVIRPTGNSISVSWPNTGSYTLQQNGNLANAAGWATSVYPVSTASGTNSITIVAPTGNLFFRLQQ
jgi:hypothetical protein